jgi:hypothetical protein
VSEHESGGPVHDRFDRVSHRVGSVGASALTRHRFGHGIVVACDDPWLAISVSRIRHVPGYRWQLVYYSDPEMTRAELVENYRWRWQAMRTLRALLRDWGVEF